MARQRERKRCPTNSTAISCSNVPVNVSSSTSVRGLINRRID